MAFGECDNRALLRRAIAIGASMKRGQFDDLAAFVAVADARNFRRAAIELGMSPSALSHAMKALEERLGYQLLSRTTRSVAPTRAGEALLTALRPALAAVDQELSRLRHARGDPTGTVRITTFKRAAVETILPMLPAFLGAYPAIQVEIDVSEGLTDVIGKRFDAGIRYGERIAKDMIALRLTPDLRMAVVGTPEYFAKRLKPRKPQDLKHHLCINYRLPTSQDFYPWSFERRGRRVQIRVGGQLIVNDADIVAESIRAGLGLGYVLSHLVHEPVAAGELISVLADWCPIRSGAFLYYPNRGKQTPAFAAFLEALRAHLAAQRPRPT